MMQRRTALLLTALALLAGCASVVKIEGEQLIGQRLSVRVSDAWNKLAVPGAVAPYEAWTQDGMALDQLRFWAAIKEGQSLVAPPPRPPAGAQAPRVPTFRAAMRPDELVGLFELVFALDGSVVTLGRVEPARFAGENGTRFEFSVLRKEDGLTLNGVGWVAVRRGELYGATFTAPRLSFFARHLPRAEAVVSSATIKGP